MSQKNVINIGVLTRATIWHTWPLTKNAFAKAGPTTFTVYCIIFFTFLFLFLKTILHFFTKQIRHYLDNIYVNKKLTMSIIKSIKQTDFTTIITTKSGKVRIYKFKTIKQNNEFYNSHI